MDPAQLDEIFTAALAEDDVAARDVYVERACHGNAALRERVAALLAAHDAAEDFLPLPDDGQPTEVQILSERPGSTIGRYKLLEQIGEGGFGVVFMAEQERPVRRRVALKVIKLGMDTKQVVARFEAERQALAMMDHPNIAKVFDAGTTETGRPYFVMELVRGEPITTYCDEARLATDERLRLFQTVCAAIQHAHQKGIIHRDLKPSNVLVTMHDDKAVPKVIDFGIAKATQARLTERTLFTEFRQLIGTPSYMSPEQAQMSGLDVDTRSDVYSLGVLLYELLTGTTPIDARQIGVSSYDEVRRLICDVDPPSPSARLSTLSAERLTTLAHQRHCEPAELAINLRSDLDWIVMRCLEKDRTRRYESASAIAQDLQRFLDGNPVEACPPTRRYRLGKFLRRNKVGVIVAGSLAALTTAAIAILVISNLRIRQASAAKDAALATAYQAVDQMLTRTADVRLSGVPLAQPLQTALLEDALKFYDGFLAQAESNVVLDTKVSDVLGRICLIQRQLGRFQEARKTHERTIRLWEDLSKTAPTKFEYKQRVAMAEQNLAYLLSITPPKPDEKAVDAHMRKSLDIFTALERDFPERRQPMLVPLRYFAHLAIKRGDDCEAERLWRDAIQRGEEYLRAKPPEDASYPPAFVRLELCWAYAEICHVLYLEEKRISEIEAEQFLLNGIREATILVNNEGGLENYREVEAHLQTQLGSFYSQSNRHAEAIPYLAAGSMDVEQLCASNPANPSHWIGVRSAHQELASGLMKAGRNDQARKSVSKMFDWLARAERNVPDEPESLSQLLQTQLQLINLLRTAGATEEAEELSRSANMLQEKLTKPKPAKSVATPADTDMTPQLP
ncbi:MAG: serine/threonine protein kinase [Pirellulales bacterium]